MMDRSASRPIVVIAGTRPECIKLASVIGVLRRSGRLTVVVLNSGQHYHAVNATFEEFGIRCDRLLQPLAAQPNLAHRARNLERHLKKALHREAPSLVIVQGDTLTAFCGARAAFSSGIECAHVEAGLRTDSVTDPFPEEWFRRRISRHAQVHFAPTRRASENLIAEGIDEGAIHTIGNTGIDALALKMPGVIALEPDRHIVLVTLHRRENWHQNTNNVCEALRRLVALRRGLHIVFAVHPNPAVASRVARNLGSEPAVSLVDPMTYSAFLRCAAGARLIISDSGGIQEEAPYLGKTLLVPRRNTERPEALTTGFVRLVDVWHGPQALVDAAMFALGESPREPIPLDRNAPFGDGRAAERMLEVLMMKPFLRRHA